MPLHDFLCCAGHTFEAFVPLVDLEKERLCDCGSPAHRVFLTAPMGIVKNVEYTSPIDGRAITTKSARIEDMARHNCVEYDPEMKKDYMKRLERDNDALGRRVEETFDAEIERMPTRKRELLEQELRSGADLELTRA